MQREELAIAECSKAEQRFFFINDADFPRWLHPRSLSGRGKVPQRFLRRKKGRGKRKLDFLRVLAVLVPHDLALQSFGILGA